MQQPQMMHKPQQQAPHASCASGCTQQHAHWATRSAQPQQMMMQPMQQQPPPMQQQPAIPHALMQPPPPQQQQQQAVFGPHPLPAPQQQPSPQMPPPLLHPPQMPPQSHPPMPAPHALDPALNTFRVQMSHPRFASIHLRCESYEPLRSWLPFIQWDGSFLESWPLQTEFRVPAHRVDECVGTLMRRGFAPMQSRLAARM